MLVAVEGISRLHAPFLACEPSALHAALAGKKWLEKALKAMRAPWGKRAERGAQRYKHMLDGDGYVSSFAFGPGNAVHFRSRYVRTRCVACSTFSLPYSSPPLHALCT
jgi:hypothetical protein